MQEFGRDKPQKKETLPTTGWNNCLERIPLRSMRTAINTDFPDVSVLEATKSAHVLSPLTPGSAPVQGKSLADKGNPEKGEESLKKTKPNWSRAQKIRHKFYDFAKFFVTRIKPIKNPYQNDEINVGGNQLSYLKEISLGGTKPMYRYQDQGQEEWLFKEAVNCVGAGKPMGAAASSAAYQLQKLVDPDSAVPTYQGGSKSHGLGSFQKRVNVDENAQDYFDWQKDENAKSLDKAQSNQILREHTTDWLLCNFDTKGENFLTDTEGKVRGIDKEQSFRYLGKKGSQRMSKTYKPNPTQTLYNVMFQKYADGKMDLDLKSVERQIQNVEQETSKEAYLKRFEEVLALKDEKEQKSFGDQLWFRKQNVREEYRTFFTALVKERIRNNGNGENLLDENGVFKFDSDTPENV